MKKSNNSLQKLTKSGKKIQRLLKQKKIKQDDLKDFSPVDRDNLGTHLTKLINEAKGDDRDELLNKLEDIIPSDTKNQLWEYNHVKITCSISKLMAEYNRMPSKIEISNDTGLSRQAIYKHLKEYASHPLYAEEIKTYRFMADKLLARVFRSALAGEVKAARLYFEVVGMMGSQSALTNINTQNNYIQINQTKLSQETIRQLTPEQLNQIEAVLESVSMAIDKK